MFNLPARALYEDRNGNLRVGHSSGLTRYSDGAFTAATTIGRQLRLSLANPDRNRNRTLTLTAYDNDGMVQRMRKVSIAAGQQTSLLVSDLFPGLRSGTIVAQADGPVTGFYEMADTFNAPRMLDAAEAVMTPLRAMIFRLTQVGGGASTEIHLFNPHEVAVRARLSAFRPDASRVALSKAQEILILQPHQPGCQVQRPGGVPVAICSVRRRIPGGGNSRRRVNCRATKRRNKRTDSLCRYEIHRLFYESGRRPMRL